MLVREPAGERARSRHGWQRLLAVDGHDSVECIERRNRKYDQKYDTCRDTKAPAGRWRLGVDCGNCFADGTEGIVCQGLLFDFS